MRCQQHLTYVFLPKYGFYFLLLGVISDLSTPYILGLFYPKLNQMTTVISVFGDVDSPVRRESSPDSCVKCYTMFLPFLLIKIDVFS